MIEIREVESFEQLVGLEGLVERVFGARRRAPGWFRRKLVREGIEAGLSGVAVDRGELCGFVLVGPGWEGVARGSMIGVEPALRGRGVGRALIDFACGRAGRRGFLRLEFSCEDERVDWYLGQGFELVERHLTLCAPGLGPVDELPIGVEAAPTGREALWSWLPQIWTRTPNHEQAYVEIDAAKIWLSREGRVWLAHRMELAALDELALALGRLRRMIAIDTPLLLYPCAAESQTAAAAMDVGFTPVQRSFLVHRTTSSIQSNSPY